MGRSGHSSLQPVAHQPVAHQRSPEGDFEIIPTGTNISIAGGIEYHYEVIHSVPDIYIGDHTYIAGGAAKRVPTPVMVNAQTGEAYVLGNLHANAGNPLSTSGFIFPFDERCFVDERGGIHPAAGFKLNIVDMIRKIEQEKPHNRPLVMSRQIVQALSESPKGQAVLRGLGVPELEMFPGKHSVSYTFGTDPATGATAVLAHVPC